MPATKRKRVKKPKGKEKMKIGDTVAYHDYYRGKLYRILFGTIVAIQKDWKVVTLKFRDYDKQVFDVYIEHVIPSNLYDHRHHALLLGVEIEAHSKTKERS